MVTQAVACLLLGMDAVDMATQFVVLIGSTALRQDKPERHNKQLVINLVNPFLGLKLG